MPPSMTPDQIAHTNPERLARVRAEADNALASMSAKKTPSLDTYQNALIRDIQVNKVRRDFSRLPKLDRTKPLHFKCTNPGCEDYLVEIFPTSIFSRQVCPICGQQAQPFQPIQDMEDCETISPAAFREIIHGRDQIRGLLPLWEEQSG